MATSYEKEQELVQGVLGRLPLDAQHRWADCKSSHRFMAYKNKQLIIYKLVRNKPVIVDTLTCTAVDLSFADGLKSTWLNAKQIEVSIGHIPLEIYPSVFLWSTFYADLQYVPHHGIYAARFPLIYKTIHNPKLEFEDVLYIQERAPFEARYL